jgi:phage recombination protein Bet
MGAVVSLNPGAEFSDRQLDLIRRTVANDCNGPEFDLFCEVARRAGLDPFRRQISAIVFSKGDETKRRMSIITGIDGLRSIAARSNRYRPDEEPPRYTYDEALKDPNSNPLGIERAEVLVYIRDDGGETWRPVAGVAYWDEFAPIKEDVEGGYDWIDTGEVWPDSGKPKKRKVPRNEGAQAIRKLDTSGQWGRMGRLMLAKCAEAQALRKAFPEDLSGLYETSELDQARAAELTASERIEAFSIENRLAKVGAANAIMLTLSPAAGIEPVPIGRVADRVLEILESCDLRWLNWFEATNTHPLREYWARAKSDALVVKKAIDERRRVLVAAEAS